MQIARELAAANVPVIRLANLPVKQPLTAAGCLGTVWDYVAGERPTFYQFGQLLRRFHDGTDRLSVQLPEWQPLAPARQRLDELADQYPQEDIALLNDWYDQISNELDGLRPVLQRGVIHGQAKVGNALLCGDSPLFLDFERIAVGPREWDLIDTSVTVLRFDQALRTTLTLRMHTAVM